MSFFALPGRGLNSNDQTVIGNSGKPTCNSAFIFQKPVVEVETDGSKIITVIHIDM